MLQVGQFFRVPDLAAVQFALTFFYLARQVVDFSLKRTLFMLQFFPLLLSDIELLLDRDHHIISTHPTLHLLQPSFFVGNYKVNVLQLV